MKIIFYICLILFGTMLGVFVKGYLTDVPKEEMPVILSNVEVNALVYAGLAYTSDTCSYNLGATIAVIDVVNNDDHCYRYIYRKNNPNDTIFIFLNKMRTCGILMEDD